MFHRATPSALRALLAAFVLVLLASASRARQPLPAEAPLQPVVDAESPCVQGDPPIFKATVPPHAPMFGDRDGALITIVAFSEFQCPFCARAAPTLKSILEEYPGKVRIVFRHQPLPFHKDAMQAAKAAMAAARQGRFWDLHDKLFADRTRLDEDSLFGHASSLGLDMQRFAADFRSEEIAQEIQFDINEANRLGARGVPTFFINGREIRGARPLADFKALIDELLPRARAAGGSGDGLYWRLVSCGHTKKPDKPERLPAERPPRPQEDPDKVHHVPAGSSYWMGSANARVEIVVFSDFQCPYCSRIAQTFAQVRFSYPEDVRIVFKHNPLPFHKDAFLAHQAALAAGAQGKFWEMHDVLFRNQRNLGRGDLEEYALQLGLDMQRFRSDLDQKAHSAVIQTDMALARELGARGTPTSYINGRIVIGAQPFESFKEKIDQALGR